MPTNKENPAKAQSKPIIAKCKQTKEALTENEKQFLTVFKNSPIPQIITSMSDFRCVDVNESFLQLLKFSREELIGHTSVELNLSADLNQREKCIQEFNAQGQLGGSEIELRTKTGKIKTTSLSCQTITLNAKKHVISFFIDITERKKLEKKVSKSLEESKRRETEISALLKASRSVLQNKEFPFSARAIFDACKELLCATAGYIALLSDDGKENIVLFLDSGGLPCTVDPSLPMPIRGLRAEAYISGRVAIENDFSKSEWQKFSPKGHVRLKNVLFAPLKIEQRTVGVIGLANKSGGFTKRDAEMAMAFGELASVALVNSKMLEILEENEKELKKHSDDLERLVEERTKKLKLSALYARNLIEASLDPLVTISAEGKITDVNKATEIATGRCRDELIGSDFSTYFVEPEKARIGYKRVFKEGVVRDYPLAIKHRNGGIVEVLYNATVYSNDKGEIQGVFAAARDISELKKAEAETVEAEKKLKDSERLAAIGATAGMVGHDIRNPLQAITGDVYLAKIELESVPDSEEKKNAIESLDEIDKNVGYINKIVADLQDFVRPIKPVAQETDLQMVCDEVLFKNGVPKNVVSSCQIDKSAKIVMVDAELLKRVISNLITNAVQAMPNGGNLWVRGSRRGTDVLIEVEDNGVGIAEEVKPKLFTPLFTTKSKGQGFGLAVVKRVTESMNGTVSYESESGKGTKFIIRLPPSPKGAKP